MLVAFFSRVAAVCHLRVPRRLAPYKGEPIYGEAALLFLTGGGVSAVPPPLRG